jgi:hypothetical protein
VSQFVGDKKQKRVSLTSSKADYIAILEAAKDICFNYFLLKVMGVDVKLPIVVRSDNVGAIFMAENLSSGIRTHHIDTRFHFVCDHVKGRLRIFLLNQTSITMTC